MTEIQQEIKEPIIPSADQKDESVLTENVIEGTNNNQIELMIKKISLLSQELKTAALSILESLQTEIKHRRKAIINLIIMITLLGSTTACSQAWKQSFEAQLDPGKYSDDPNVQRGYDIYLRQEAERNATANTEDITQTPESTSVNQNYEILENKQELTVGSKVVVDTKGIGLNIRNVPSTNSDKIVTTYPDGTILIIDELAGTRDGYDWVSVTTEEGEFVGYAATNWLKPIEH